MTQWSRWRVYDGRNPPKGFHYVQALDGNKVQYDCPASELCWKIKTLGGQPDPSNLFVYRIRIPKGLTILKKLVASIPEERGAPYFLPINKQN